MALEWPWSYPGQSTVESGGNALKTGCVTGALVKCTKGCPYISRIIGETESQPLSGSDLLFLATRGGKPLSNVQLQFQLLLRNCGWIRPSLITFYSLFVLVEHAF